MSRGINKVIIMGNLGAEPEMRATPDGTQIAKLSIATESSWIDKNTREKHKKIEWHKVWFMGSVAELISEKLKKGDKIYVEGSLTTYKWEDKMGKMNYMTKIIGKEIEFLNSNEGKKKSISSSPPPIRNYPEPTVKTLPK